MPLLVTEGGVLPQIFNPMALLFKDEGGLAKHSLSCHSLLKGCLAGEKIQEKERK